MAAPRDDDRWEKSMANAGGRMDVPTGEPAIEAPPGLSTPEDGGPTIQLPAAVFPLHPSLCLI